MSIVIKGMEMPSGCKTCIFRDGITCKACGGKRVSYSAFEQRDYFCPLVEVHTPHGRLIDADALLKKMLGKWTVYDFAVLGTMPIIIEAEEET